MIATHVTIDDKETYRLGATSSRDSKIACIASDGLVHRVCYWQSGGIEANTTLYTSGNLLRYHNGAESVTRRLADCA